MRLLIIGHTSHYLCGDQIVGWGPTVKEVDWLAKSFDNVTHLTSAIFLDILYKASFSSLNSNE